MYKPDLRTLRGQLNRRGRDRADIRWARYVRGGPALGMHYVRSPFSDAEKLVGSAIPDQSFKPGQSVGLGSHTGTRDEVIIAATAPGRGGAALFPFPQRKGADIDAYGVESCDPEDWPAWSVDLAVTISGWGYIEDPPDTFRSVLWNEGLRVYEADPDVEIEFVEWIDEHTVHVLVTVAQQAPSRPINIEVTRS